MADRWAFLESLELLPPEIKTNFSLMKDLDTRAQDEMKKADALTFDLLTNFKNLSPEGEAESMCKITQSYKKAQDYADHKVQLASQTHEMVRGHIKRLDGDFGQLERDLRAEELNLHSNDENPEASAAKKKDSKIAEQVEKKDKRMQSSDDEIEKAKKKEDNLSSQAKYGD